MASGSECTTGSVIGTGADLSIEKVGFKPRIVLLLNITDPCKMEFYEDMADDHAWKDHDGTMTYSTTNGITPTAQGFDIGADTDMNVDGEIMHYACWR